MKNLAGILFSIGLVMATSSQAATYADIGDVENVSGSVMLESPAKTRKVAKGDSLFEGETIITTEDGVLKALMSDGTSLSVTPNSKLKLTKFLVKADKPEGGLEIQRGAFRLISGQINKVNNGTLSITTPIATLGIRGTDFYADAKSDELKVALIDNGVVDITTNDGKTITLDEPMTFIEIKLGEELPPIKTFSQSELQSIEDSFEVKSSSIYLQLLLFLALAGYISLMYFYNKKESK